MKIISRNKKISKIKNELIYFSKLAYDRRLTCASGGNISQKIKDDLYMVSTTNSCMRSLSPADLILVDANGNPLEHGKIPSKEISMHMAIYENIPEVKSVLHLHPLYVTAYSTKNIKEGIPLVTVSAQLKIKKILSIDSASPGSKMLAELVAEEVKKMDNDASNCFLLKNHGIISFGKNVEEAFNLAELLEDTAKIAFIKDNIAKNIN